MMENMKHVVMYDDHDTESLSLGKEKWQYKESDAISESQSGFNYSKNQ